MSLTRRKRVNVPSKPAKSAEQRKLEAYERLGVKQDDVGVLPQITHILNKIPDGGVNKAIEFLRGSSEDEARKWLRVYDSLADSVRQQLPFEAFCLACGITTKRALELVTGACFEQSANTSALMAAAAHPMVVAATIDNAVMPDGDKDRKMLHEHAKFVPTNKNQTTIIGAGGTQNNLSGESKQLNIGVGELAKVDDKMSQIANRFNERIGLLDSKDVKEVKEIAE